MTIRQIRGRPRPAAVLVILLAAAGMPAHGQKQPELETALVKAGRIWVGVTANGDKGNFDYRAGFFPNDYDVIGVRGQEQDLWSGAGFRLAAVDWRAPDDSLHAVAVYGPTNEFMPQGRVVVPLTNFIRFRYPEQTVDFRTVDLEDFGVHDPDAFGGETCDQAVGVTTRNVLGVEIRRRILAWAQDGNDDYLIVDAEFTNAGDDTLKEFFIQVESNGANTYRSNGSNPAPGPGERFDPAKTWQHYYGGRTGDSLRVFYEYSADDPEVPGDNMGAPVPSQGGRLINAGFCWVAVLHASGNPYADAAEDADDFLQPRVTYAGKDNLIPYNDQGDEFGNRNFWALRGGYADVFPMSGAVWPGTRHAGNTDEQGSSDYAGHPAGTHEGNNSKMWASFGPYTFPPGRKIRIVTASGFSGLGLQTAKTVGAQWMQGTLEEPPGLPDTETGFFPPNFVFPMDATAMDRVKDRWLSTGVDSVMKSASRALWNFSRGYRIPRTPPPPESLTITGLGTGVEIRWFAPAAEALPGFAGYRITRRISNLDTVFYETIYSSGPDDRAAEHLFTDTDVLIGAQYYYILQSKAQIGADDPDAHPSLRGKVISGGRSFHPNILWINPPHHSQDDLSRIRIVPNPYNINDPLLVRQGWTDQRGVQFYNLPGRVTIKIFTENGDLVQTIEHDSPVRSGYAIWDMITRNQQVVNSGLYIVTFQTPGGGLSFQKFAVIR